MLDHGISRLLKHISHAQQQLARLETDTDMRASRRDMFMHHWRSVIVDCTSCLNIIYAERRHADLKRKGIL